MFFLWFFGRLCGKKKFTLPTVLSGWWWNRTASALVGENQRISIQMIVYKCYCRIATDINCSIETISFLQCICVGNSTRHFNVDIFDKRHCWVMYFHMHCCKINQSGTVPSTTRCVLLNEEQRVCMCAFAHVCDFGAFRKNNFMCIFITCCRKDRQEHCMVPILEGFVRCLVSIKAKR